MKIIVLLKLFFILTLQGFCATIEVKLKTKHKDNLENLTAIKVFDSDGKQIVEKELQGENPSVEIPDSIKGPIKIRINAFGYFPIDITYFKKSDDAIIEITDVLLVPSLRRKLPKNATCIMFAPREKDIPKKIYFGINGKREQLVPDKEGVIGITYIRSCLEFLILVDFSDK